MKSLLTITLIGLLAFSSLQSCAQKDKSKRPSPPAIATQKIGQTTVSIDYSQPSVKGRTIGVDLEPMPGKIWRAGANEATVFEVDKDVMIEGKLLPKGKYSFYVLQEGSVWTAIFNKTWDQWGTKYTEADDQLRVSARGSKPAAFAEKLTYTINADGTVSLLWGDNQINFTVKEKK